jgi:hypothetical protein
MQSKLGFLKKNLAMDVEEFHLLARDRYLARSAEKPGLV